jgi:hypothetical protein
VKTLTISDEMAEFIKNLAHTIETQDTRCTKNPIYFTVRMHIDEVCAEDCGDRFIYITDDGTKFTRDELEERFLDEKEDEDDEIDDYIDKNYRKIEVRDGEKYKGFFLTKNGYDQHVKMDGHNISCNENGYDSYVEHLYRNPEMEQVIKFILETGKQL